MYFKVQELNLSFKLNNFKNELMVRSKIVLEIAISNLKFC